MRLLGHNHGTPINPYTCGKNLHAICDGFSGDYDTYICACCCHDGDYHPRDLTDDDRAVIARVRGETTGRAGCATSPPVLAGSVPAPTDTETETT